MSKNDNLVMLAPMTLSGVQMDAKTLLDRKVKMSLFNQLGEIMYRTWIHYNKITFHGLDRDGKANFDCQYGFSKSHILHNFNKQLTKAFEDN